MIIHLSMAYVVQIKFTLFQLKQDFNIHASD